MTADLIVDTDWLASHANHPSIVVIDVRAPTFYRQAHIPGATNVPFALLSWSAGRMPDAETVQRALSHAGVSRRTHIVVYDDGAGPDGAMVCFVLDYYRHPRFSLLDGGMTKWLHEARDAQEGVTETSPAAYDVGEPNLEVLASLQSVKEDLHRADAAIVDTRSSAEYMGIQPTASRDGHIPGAVNIDYVNNLVRTGEEIIQHRDPDELRDLYLRAGVTPDKRVVVYCQTGARSSESYVALRALGYPRVANYVRGWQEWGNAPDTPVEDA